MRPLCASTSALTMRARAGLVLVRNVLRRLYFSNKEEISSDAIPGPDWQPLRHSPFCRAERIDTAQFWSELQRIVQGVGKDPLQMQAGRPRRRQIFLARRTSRLRWGVGFDFVLLSYPAQDTVDLRRAGLAKARGPLPIWRRPVIPYQGETVSALLFRFSRIPSVSGLALVPLKQHICIPPYSRGFLIHGSASKKSSAVLFQLFLRNIAMDRKNAEGCTVYGEKWRGLQPAPHCHRCAQTRFIRAGSRARPGTAEALPLGSGGRVAILL